jgi:hypothetical protein
MLKHGMYCAVILALLAFGYWYTERADQAGYDRAVAEYKTRQSEALTAQLAVTQQLQTDLAKASGDLATAQQIIDKRNRTIAKLEDKYATLAQNSDLCNLSVGSSMLHNAALGYGYDSRKLESEGGAVSTNTGAAFISHCNGLAGTFERQRAQLNELIVATDKLERVCGR